ncbi:MAG: hypothetical protein ABFS46_21610, partial [Myxococcota bacterium]
GGGALHGGGRSLAVRPSRLLDPADRLRVETAVHEARRATSCEIVVMVVRDSNDYPGAAWRLGLLLAALGALGASIFLASPALLEILAIQGLGVAAGHGLARSDALRRRLISRQLAEASVERRAARAFAEQGLCRRSGALVFVSLLERHALVLAGGELAQPSVSEARWQEVIDPLLVAMHEGRAADGLVRAVEDCATLLALREPGAGDSREAPGLVLEDASP